MLQFCQLILQDALIEKVFCGIKFMKERPLRGHRAATLPVATDDGIISR